MKNILVSILLLFLTLFSCKQEKQGNIKVKKEKQKTETSSMPITAVEKQKLFLDFQYGMNYEEYINTAKKLVDNKKLVEKGFREFYYNYVKNIDSIEKNLGNLTYYSYEDCLPKIKSVFKDNILTSIVLENAECIYSLYQNKYNLPDLIKKPLAEEVYITNNPDYNPVYSYKNNYGRVVELNSAFVDKSDFLKKAIFLEPYGTKYILQKNPLIINKDNVVIKITNDVWESPFGDTYLLEESEEMKAYIKSKEFLFPFSEESKYIKTNSKLKKVTLIKNSKIDIEYMLKTDYKTDRANELQKEREQSNIRQEKRNKRIERANSVEDEI